MRRLPWPLLLAHEEDELLRDLLFGKKKDLEEGRAYLVKEKKPERALAAFQRAVDAGWRPIYITRQHPNHVVRHRGDKEIRVVWLPWPLLLAHEEDELLRDLLFGKKKDLEEGRAYLVKEKKPERALAAFQRAVDAGWRPIYITRQHPNHVVRHRGDKEIRVVWLSH